MKLKQKVKHGFCQAYGCSRVSPGRTLCHTHRTQKRREADPIRYSYEARKHNAKRRGKPFTITLEYYREFCHAVNFIGLKRGRHGDSYTVNCIINELGYVPGNLQMLTNRDNVKKYFTYDWQSKVVYEVKRIETETDLPF